MNHGKYLKLRFNEKEDLVFSCYTLELPFKNNQVSISRIPKGNYLCKFIFSAKHKFCYSIESVHNRQNILIHKGNFVQDTHGCILIGLSRSLENESIFNSKKALEQLSSIAKSSFKLSII